MSTEHDDLDPIDPETALELYLDHKEPHVAEAALRNQRYRLGHLVRWCEETGLDNLNDLRGRSIHEFRLWCKEDGDLSAITLSGNMSTLWVFLEWAATIEAVSTALHEKVLVPRVDQRTSTRA